ncbi:chloride channel protein [Luminiphilus sp.]|nr:chloride channel protein [Luminiphilus sp.]MDA9722315.1 chloride channel protein [Luminiphilus sp.]
MLLLNPSLKELGLELVRVLFVGLVIGTLGGLAANLFVLGVGEIDGLIREQMVGQSALSAGLIRWSALIAGAFGIYGLKQAFRMDRWHGPADAILGAHRPDAPFPAREGFISTTAAFVSASAGASVGQYGPVLHFGASVGAQVRALFPTRLTPDIYVACGVAAAISAGFGAPIAAVVLVSEAILRHFAVRAVAPITVSAIVATAVTPLFFDRVSPYSVTASPTDWGLIPVVLGLGACAAILAIVFMRSLLRTAAWAKSLNNELAMLLLAATLMALIGMLVPESVGLGTQSVNDLLAGEKLVGEAALMLVAKLGATVVCIGLGLVGGVFSPALFLGASLGYLAGFVAVGLGFDSSAVVMLTVVGMAAVAGSVIGAPIGVVLIVFEFTRSYEFAVAAILAVSMSSFISTRLFCYSFFDRQLIARGFDLRQGREFLSLKDISVADLDVEAVESVTEGMTGEDLVAHLRASHRTEAYVVNPQGTLTGVVPILSALSNPDKTASALIGNDYLVLNLGDDLQQALGIARRFVGEAIPVVDEAGALVGCLSEGAILGGTLDRQEEVKGRERN